MRLFSRPCFFASLLIAGTSAAQTQNVHVELAYRGPVDGQPKPNFSPKGTQVALTELAATATLPPGSARPAKRGLIKVGPDERSWIQVLTTADADHPSDLSRLFLDRNRNGDFLDDGPAMAGAPAQNAKTKAWWTSINKVELSIPYAGGNTESYLVNFWIVREDSGVAPDILRYSVGSWRYGTTTINGVDALVAVMDGDNDALFTKGDMWSVLSRSDSNPEKDVLSIAEARPTNRLMFLTGGVTDIPLEFRSISPDGRSIDFAVIDRPITKAADRGPDDLVRDERTRPRATVPFVWGHGRKDFTAALANAKTSGRKILLDFEATWCGPCHTMDQWIWNDAEVAAELSAGYIGVKIDVDLEKSLARQFKTSAYPTMIVLDPAGKEIKRVLDYQSSKEMLLVLKRQPSTGTAARAAAREYRQGHEREILDEFVELLAIPNLASDSVNIRRNADHLVGMLGKRGFTNTQQLTVPGGPPVVYGELPSPGATRTLVLYAHYDGQPLDPKQWTSPPWSPVLRDKEPTAGGKVIPLPANGRRADPESRLYGRSAGDDKASIMAILAAVDAMRATRTKQSVNLKVFFEGEEEAGSAHLRQILEKYSTLLAADAWLFCDGPVHQSGRQLVLFGNRGIVSFELTVYGATRALHSGHYGNWAPNPGVMLANLVSSMRDDDGRIKIAGYYDDMKPVTAAEHRAVAALPKFDPELRKALGLAHTEANDALLAERIMLPAFNLRGMRVGGVRETGSNTIATEAYASFDLRLVPGQIPEHVRQLVEAHVRKEGYFVTHDSATAATRLAHAKVARIEWSEGYPASRAPMDGPFGKAVIGALSDGAPETPLLMPTSGGTGPTYMFEQVLKIPMIHLPIANYDDNQHAADENLRLKNLWDGIELYSALLAGIGKTWGTRVVP